MYAIRSYYAITGTALPAVLAASANLTYPVVYYADTFAIYLDTQNSAGSVTATLGYSTNGTNFTSLGVSKTISHGSRADRVYQFKLVDVVGKTIAAGQRLAIQITDTGATGVKINYGNATYRGDITVADVITSYSIHYTKLYEYGRWHRHRHCWTP